METKFKFSLFNLILISFICCCNTLYGQHIDTSGVSISGDIYHLGGKVGIGTIPGSELDIKSPTNDPCYIYLNTSSVNKDAGLFLKENGTTQWVVGHKASQDMLRFCFKDNEVYKNRLVIKNDG